jgi:hypothetical protein
MLDVSTNQLQIDFQTPKVKKIEVIEVRRTDLA